MALEEPHPAQKTLTNDEISRLLDVLEERWTKYRYARNRLEKAKEDAFEAITAVYPHVTGSRIAEITGFDRTRAHQIYHERQGA